MTKISAIYHRFQILISQMFISLGIITNAYNAIMTLFSTQFSRLIMEFWHYEGEVPPELPRNMVCYYTLSGVMGYLAHTAAITARNRTVTRLQPVIDDLFKQLLTTSLYNKGPLNRNSLDLTPSKEATAYIEQRLREKAFRTQAAPRSFLSQPPLATSVLPRSNLPPELAAIARRTSVQAPAAIPQTPKQAGISTQHTGSSMGTVGLVIESNSPLVTPRITHMPLFSSVCTTAPIHIDAEYPSYQPAGQQHIIVDHQGVRCPLGPGSPSLDATRTSDDPGESSHHSRQSITRGLSSLFGQRGLGIRELGHQQEGEESRTEGTTRTQYGPPQQCGLCCDSQGSEAEEGGETEEASGREALTGGFIPQRRKRRRPRTKHKGERYQPGCDPPSTTSTLNMNVNAFPVSVPHDMLPLSDDMLLLHDTTANNMLCNDHLTITFNNLVCDVNTNITVTPNATLATLMALLQT